MLNKFADNEKLDRIQWVGDDLAQDLPDLIHPYLFVLDMTNKFIEMYSEPIEHIDCPIIAIHKIDSFRYCNGINTLFTKSGKINPRWIPRGYKFECYSLVSGYDYYALLVVSKKGI